MPGFGGAEVFLEMLVPVLCLFLGRGLGLGERGGRHEAMGIAEVDVLGEVGNHAGVFEAQGVGLAVGVLYGMGAVVLADFIGPSVAKSLFVQYDVEQADAERQFTGCGGIGFGYFGFGEVAGHALELFPFELQQESVVPVPVCLQQGLVGSDGFALILSFPHMVCGLDMIVE